MEALVNIHALAVTSSGTLIIDSGATCQMCKYKKPFIDMRHLDTPQQMTLGDGSLLEGPADGRVKLDMILPDRTTQKCKRENILYVLKLPYSSLSVLKSSTAGKPQKLTSHGAKL